MPTYPPTNKHTVFEDKPADAIVPFSRRFLEARVNRNLSIYAVSLAVGIRTETIRRIETMPWDGMRWIDVVRLARYYDLDHDDLVRLMDEAARVPKLP